METERRYKEAETSFIGKQLGDYQVLSFIAQGGQASVYRARDSKLGREAAIKVLPPELSSDPQIIGRLEKEASLASSLNHPNIVTIYGIHREHSTFFIAMELIDGKTLHDVLSRGRMQIPVVLQTSAQIAAGLSKAHEAGIVHGDLKSRNVMINSDGIAKILDFGLGKVVPPVFQSTDEVTTASTSSTAKMGGVVGTIDYMSPQQASGQAVDFRSDQFSFGVLLYEMITGALPFRQPTPAQTLASIIEDEPKPISKLNPAAPPALQTIVDRCLAKSPEDRYNSTKDLAIELRKLSDSQSKKQSGLRRRNVFLGLLLIAALLCVAVYQGAPWIQKAWQRLFASNPGGIQLAVLPFANVDNDPASRAFCAGLVENLTTKLSQLQQFHESLLVVPASEVRNEGVSSVREARKLFGVTMAITGSIQRISGRIRMTINLVDAATRRQVDGRSIDTGTSDLGVLQDGVLLEATDLLSVKLTKRAKQVLAAGETKVGGAYELYATGRGLLQQYDSLDNIDKAIGFFGRALEKDPRYGLAHAGLGEAYWRKYVLTKDARWAEQAKRDCETALQFSSNLAPVEVTLGMVETGTGRYEEAIHSLQQALTLDPVNPDAYRELAKAYQALGKLGEAESTYKKAIAVRPGLWMSRNELGKFYYRQGRYREAEAEYRAILELTPDNAIAHNNLGALYCQQERYQEAAAMFERLVATKPSVSAYSNLGTAYFSLGRYSDAARMLDTR